MKTKLTFKFSNRDKKLISQALGELAASKEEGSRAYTYAVNVMNKWDDLPNGTIELRFKLRDFKYVKEKP